MWPAIQILVIEGYYFFVHPFIFSLRVGYLKAISTSYWQTISITRSLQSNSSLFCSTVAILKALKRLYNYYSILYYLHLDQLAIGTGWYTQKTGIVAQWAIRTNARLLSKITPTS